MSRFSKISFGVALSASMMASFRVEAQALPALPPHIIIDPNPKLCDTDAFTKSVANVFQNLQSLADCRNADDFSQYKNDLQNLTQDVHITCIPDDDDEGQRTIPFEPSNFGYWQIPPSQWGPGVPSLGTGSRIYWQFSGPDDLGSDGEIACQQSQPDSGLVHELQHALTFSKGMMDEPIASYLGQYPGADEVLATTIENEFNRNFNQVFNVSDHCMRDVYNHFQMPDSALFQCCDPSLVGCHNNCVDIGNDPDNCGVCDNACAFGAECQNAGCLCPANQVVCNGVCDDTTTDNSNCGGCGTVCDTSEASHCCGGSCTSPTDLNNCGGCNNKCAPTEICDYVPTQGSRCICPPPPPCQGYDCAGAWDLCNDYQDPDPANAHCCWCGSAGCIDSYPEGL